MSKGDTSQGGGFDVTDTFLEEEVDVGEDVMDVRLFGEEWGIWLSCSRGITTIRVPVVEGNWGEVRWGSMENIS